MKQGHSFLTAYGKLRLSVGEANDELARRTDETLDRLIWKVFGITDSDRLAVLSRGFIVGAGDGEEEDQGQST